MDELPFESNRLARRKSTLAQISAKQEKSASYKKVAKILQKPDDVRTSEESEMLLSYKEVADDVKQRLAKRSIVKQRLLEIEEPEEELVIKCKVLARCIKESQHFVIYTGAGISTAARIPDYRGTNGIWTRLQQGKDIGTHDLSLADPTYTHMALSTLYHRGLLKYIVSQNCDGLHLRSGLPRSALSELHGNMTIEVCKQCKPHREYWRLFDVTENTARYSHKTMRHCYQCNNPLIDTIVHFGERGTLQWPLNWPGACKNADSADTILCLGSSLKVLKKYPWLWQMDKPAKKRPNLFIVNLQWTPKDDHANMKIHGKCDKVMEIIMEELGIKVKEYNRESDPIFGHFSDIIGGEMHTKTQPELKRLKEEEEEIKSEVEVKSEIIDLTDDEDDKSLVTTSIINNLFTGGNPFPLLYYPNPLLYPIPTWYPFQTSLLYSGLHSIINPGFHPQTQSIIPAIAKPITPKCKFCHSKYESFDCLFYTKFEPEFRKPIIRYSKSQKCNRDVVCECCDCSSASDEEESGKDEDIKKVKEEELVEGGVKVQPGWFGKGYRKRKKTKR